MRTRIERSMLLAAALSVTAFALAEAPDASPERIARLVHQLGSARFAERESATRSLDALGEPALESLRAAATASDPETKRRASELVERIGQRVSLERLLKPTTLALSFRDTPLEEAVKSLARQTGLQFELSPTGKFAGRKVTVHCEPMPIWDAIELFCRKADIHEWDGLSQSPGVPQTDSSGRGNVAFGGLQGQVIFNGRDLNRSGGFANSKLLLLDGPEGAVPRHLAGAVRLRVLPHGTPFPHAINSGEFVLPIQVSAESRLQWIGATAMRIDRAVDEFGKSIEVAGILAGNSSGEDVAWIPAPNGLLMAQTPTRLGPAALRVVRPDRDSRRLQEIAGQLTGQVRTSSGLVRMPAPFKPGESSSVSGVTLKLNECSEPSPGEIKLSVEIVVPSDVQISGVVNPFSNGRVAIQGAVVVQQMAIQGNGRPSATQLQSGTTEYAGLAIEDEQGRRWSAVAGSQEIKQLGPQGVDLRVTVTFKSPAADSTPARLTLTGSRPQMVAIPFAFRDVPLP